MTKRLLSSLLAVAVLGSSGCLFHRRAKKAKESSNIATETEKEFQQRWVTKRVGELTAQGASTSAAEQQAAQEFRAQYSYATPKGK